TPTQVHEEIFGVPDSFRTTKDSLANPGAPLVPRVKRYLRNAELLKAAPGEAQSLATSGIGTSVAVRELPPVSGDEETDLRTALIEPVAGGRSYGTWLVSNGLGAPQSFIHEGRTYMLSMRPRPEYLPYSPTLKKICH